MSKANLQGAAIRVKIRIVFMSVSSRCSSTALYISVASV